MNELYKQLKSEAESLKAKLPEPAFYRIFRQQLKRSSDMLIKSDILRNCINHLNLIQEELGHGFEHSKAVAIEAGALVLIEASRYEVPKEEHERMVLIAHLAGLLHDIKRGAKDHARKASEEVAKYLDCHDLNPLEVEYIKIAIRNHEAFQDTVEPVDNRGRLISDCLYDADKFRWGPDNFTSTVWFMLEFSKVSPEEFFKGFNDGIRYIEKVKDTFRTKTGKTYGPEIIEIGLYIGARIYQKLKKAISSF